MLFGFMQTVASDTSGGRQRRLAQGQTLSRPHTGSHHSGPGWHSTELINTTPLDTKFSPGKVLGAATGFACPKRNPKRLTQIMSPAKHRTRPAIWAAGEIHNTPSATNTRRRGPRAAKERHRWTQGRQRTNNTRLSAAPMHRPLRCNCGFPPLHKPAHHQIDTTDCR